MDDSIEFNAERLKIQDKLKTNVKLSELTNDWMGIAQKEKYSYQFDWFGRPIIQYPQDIMAIQELIFSVKPTLIIETGVARGGSLIYTSSLLHLLDKFSNDGEERRVIGVDIEIRPHNRAFIESHPFADKISLLEGSSTDKSIMSSVKGMIRPEDTVLVFLDSDHTEEHVYNELVLYAEIVSPNSYIVVFDTLVEDQDANLVDGGRWGPNNSPKSATWRFLSENESFSVDTSYEDRHLITVAKGGFLQRNV
jgi:cephalosporin hydroxylase